MICGIFFDDDDSLGLQVIYNRTYAQKVELFDRLISERQRIIGKEIPIFPQLVDNLKTIGNLRNIVVHADWESIRCDDYILSKLKIYKDGLQHEYVQFSPESLNKIIEKIDETIEMFCTYEEQIQDFYG